MKNFGKSQALHAGFAKAKVKSSQWMLIYKIVLKARLIQYDYLKTLIWFPVGRKALRFSGC
jgi:hypothetical protein